MLTFLKNWTLPVAMLMGTLTYFLFANVSFLAPLKPMVGVTVTYLTPFLIFMQLLLTFCKVPVSDLKPVKWHGWLLSFQLVSCWVVAGVLLYIPMEEAYLSLWEGAMVCLICPTATAAAVITRKLGGNAGSLTTYTLLSNILAAMVVPLIFPLVEPHADQHFLQACSRILWKVFPLLLCPFVVACLLRACWPKACQFLGEKSHYAFYLWGLALAIVSGQTVRSLVNSEATVGMKLLIAGVALVACGLQFYMGKRIGGHYHERISGGQALGQKNTVLAIWMAYTYLNPLSSVAPGSYVLWQNLMNSWQLWKMRKKDAESSRN